MSQVCIMNTTPELTVASCNTICNSRVTCMQCVPPYRIKRNSGYNKRKKEFRKSDENLSESHLNLDDPTSNNNSILGSSSNMYSIRSRFFIQQLSEHLSSNLEPESLIDYDSSEDDEADSQSGGEQQQATPPSNSSIPSLLANNFQDVKHSTMWIGNEDGRQVFLSFFCQVNSLIWLHWWYSLFLILFI